MSPKHLTNTAIRSLRNHLMRSALTILGIVIGVAAIIIVTSLGQGAQQLILDQVSGLGPETVVIRPGKSPTDFTNVLTMKSLSTTDVAALERRQNVPDYLDITPFIIMAQPVEYQSELYSASMIGGSAEFIANLLKRTVVEGALYTKQDIDQQARVIIIGSDIKEDIFGNGRAVGEQVTIKNRKFTVAGVFSREGSSGPFDIDKIVLMPHTTAQTYVTGNNNYNQIMVRANDPAAVDKMAFDITRTLREEHDIAFGRDADFHLQTQEEVIAQIDTIVTIFTSFLIAVVSISLVVGGIGIMNIMLVSVSERTTEIGLRKALGARHRDIRNQFLTEAVILTSIGGVIGIFVGTLIAFVASLVLAETVASDWRFVFPMFGSLLGVGVSAGVGLLFGIYPATKAAKKSPIEALRG